MVQGSDRGVVERDPDGCGTKCLVPKHKARRRIRVAIRILEVLAIRILEVLCNVLNWLNWLNSFFSQSLVTPIGQQVNSYYAHLCHKT